ncbi:hypothetical protein EXU85_17930 [Spirosoma sp. KCTC 42546]|uniref:hypothetical protein n=1 Tax=Spirosoma sp. KCTC 42546 TaxID=2520506 RepID=UPI00115B25CA|nr:hypothetical protein [Spirosoma sp. KCTC 42546]QDK80380.1 hypothetical protein EXU85_17930 [Spirosoma sp. KCTC 42546]
MGKLNDVRLYVVVFILLCLNNIACKSSSSHTDDLEKQITSAFYHWKVAYNPTRSEVRELKRLTVNKLYVHFFDVDWDARTRQPVPKAFVQFQQKPVGTIVPVVFITNRTLMNVSPNGLPELATHITQAIKRISQKSGLAFSEVQVDCDWSTSTRDRYFRLLTLLKNRLNCPLSATIRLHQIKYTDQTGIPPVTRGMLMLYNVDDWKRADTRNSIYDPDVANQYLSFVSTYPLPLDLVMPLFRWTIVYRNNRFLIFLTNLDRQTLAKSHFLAPQSDSTRFVATRDTSAFGIAIRRGDLFRSEAVPSDRLLQEKARLLNQISNQRLTFALYHLDSTILSSYPRETLQTLLQSPKLP